MNRHLLGSTTLSGRYGYRNTKSPGTCQIASGWTGTARGRWSTENARSGIVKRWNIASVKGVMLRGARWSGVKWSVARSRGASVGCLPAASLEDRPRATADQITDTQTQGALCLPAMAGTRILATRGHGLDSNRRSITNLAALMTPPLTHRHRRRLDTLITHIRARRPMARIPRRTTHNTSLQTGTRRPHTRARLPSQALDLGTAALPRRIRNRSTLRSVSATFSISTINNSIPSSNLSIRIATLPTSLHRGHRLRIRVGPEARVVLLRMTLRATGSRPKRYHRPTGSRQGDCWLFKR